eukprot:TRINITY_DN15462_c0_g1_i1.p1 TRINITY_DN15462_c0_g1~~TRINITY_DN15462_c0_g1_i1.p1  ORF type:complete len:113 (+),score=18.47 TRINITY_DN15462_c0_g1_i1:29-340(+)
MSSKAETTTPIQTRKQFSFTSPSDSLVSPVSQTLNQRQQRKKLKDTEMFQRLMAQQKSQAAALARTVDKENSQVKSAVRKSANADTTANAFKVAELAPSNFAL